MSEKQSKRRLAVAGVWIVIIAIIGVVGKLVIGPMLEEGLIDNTGSESQYKHTVTLAADSFSGYAVLRSDVMSKLLRTDGIRLDVKDDQADYGARLKALKNGKTDLAVFTVDSLITAGAKLGDFPATIVMVIDETKGADAIVAHKSSVANIQALDDADARLVLTPSSPSEFLARVMLAHFSLPSLPSDWSIAADGAGDVYQKFKVDDKSKKRAYVLWEPYVSKALQESGAHVLLDSGKLKGYVVDVLVARRKFLSEHPDLVSKVVEAYLRAAFSAKKKPEGMVDLVREDAKKTGSEKLSKVEAKGLVAGIRWKNTLENYAHFGVAPPEERAGVQHLEDIIGNIIAVLLKTDALKSDPLEGKIATLFYVGTMQKLHGADFHPGKKINIVEGLGDGMKDLDKARTEGKLPALTKEQWAELIPVGNLRADPISFTRGGHEITVSGRNALNQLARHMEAWPRYYVKVTGHARAIGDRDANLKLIDQRSDATVQYLKTLGIGSERMQKGAAELSKTGGEAQSVSFLFLQSPY